MSFKLENLGKQFILQDPKITVNDEQIKTSKLIGLYFGASWSEQSKRFLPTLLEFYKLTNQNSKQFEVIYISNDNQEKEFYDQVKLMPWPAIDWKDINRLNAYKLNKEKIKGIPTLVIFDAVSGKFVSADGRGNIEQNASGCFKEWESIKSSI